MLNLNEIRANLNFGGARGSHFQVLLSNPIVGSGDRKLTFTCKNASLPASTITPIEVPYFGRTIKVEGSRPSFGELSLTVLNDEDFIVRDSLESWMSWINHHRLNLISGSGNPAEYKSQAEVHQVSRSGQILRKYQFLGVWPSEVGQIDLDWSSGDAIEEFAITLQYDWWEINGGQTGNGGTS